MPARNGAVRQPDFPPSRRGFRGLAGAAGSARAEERSFISSARAAPRRPPSWTTARSWSIRMQFAELEAYES